MSRATKEVVELRTRREVTLRKQGTAMKARLILNDLRKRDSIEKKDLKTLIMGSLGIMDRHTITGWIRYLEMKSIIQKRDSKTYLVTLI